MKSIEAIVREMEKIPWFANLGKPSPRDEEVFRIFHWDTWPGPENPGGELQSAYHMLWKHEIIGKEKEDTELAAMFDAVERRILAVAKTHVPYREDQDAWYGPNTAAWSASWVAALVACNLLKTGSLPGDGNRRMQWTLRSEWQWYLAGHWPCTYYWQWGYRDVATAELTGGPKQLVVY